MTTYLMFLPSSSIFFPLLLLFLPFSYFSIVSITSQSAYPFPITFWQQLWAPGLLSGKFILADCYDDLIVPSKININISHSLHPWYKCSRYSVFHHIFKVTVNRIYHNQSIEHSILEFFGGTDLQQLECKCIIYKEQLFFPAVKEIILGYL